MMMTEIQSSTDNYTLSYSMSQQKFQYNTQHFGDRDNKRRSIETAAVRDYHILAAGLIIVIKKLLSKTYQARQSRSGCSYLRDKYCSFSSDADS